MGEGSKNTELPVRIRGFAPLVGRDPQALILGSMPSEKSLEEDEYYAHPRNRFWSLMNWLLAGNKTRPAYKTGIEILSSHGIALWDSVGSCVREGSQDSAIREIEPEDIRRSHTLLYMTAVLALVVFEVVKVLVCLWYFTVQV